MRIKRFEAPDNQTALRMVKEEMGDEALILATRSLSPAERRGSDARVEVVAAIDFDQGDKAEHGSLDNEDLAAPDMTYDYSIVRRQPAAAPAGQSPAGQASGRSNANQPAPAVKAEAELARIPVPTGRPSPPAGQPTAAGKTPADREAIARWRDQLIAQIRVEPPRVNTNQATPTILAMVGATGVGKTTTAAKLAAWYSLREGRRVTLLSMDCYRIGATDQLRTYAKIMRLPCEIVLRPKELRAAIDRHRTQDVLIIDTAGKSPYNAEHIDELGEWFAAGPTIDPYLVVSATTKKEDMEHTIKTYRRLPPTGIMVTKLDETRAYASLCQQLAAATLPVAALAFGQRVPEDFMMASEDFLSTLFREGWNAATAEMGAA